MFVYLKVEVSALSTSDIIVSEMSPAASLADAKSKTLISIAIESIFHVR